jgi:hypothetical protein
MSTSEEPPSFINEALSCLDKSGYKKDIQELSQYHDIS